MADSDKQTNFRLRDGREILIGTDINTNGRDVQRISILNNTVWEKTKSTTLRLSSSPSTVNSGQTFTLTATIVDSSETGINGNIIFQGSGINGTKTITAKNGIATLNNVSTTNIGTNTYTATFASNDYYLGSTATTTVKINKETPILTKVGETTVYDTWTIGVKLTKSDGKTALSNRTISCIINGETYKSKTNSKGIAPFTIHTSIIGTGTKTIKYMYRANDEINSGDKNKYNGVTISHNYKINNYISKTLTIHNSNLGTQTNTQQKWKSISGGYQCLDVGVTCSYDSDRLRTIATSSGVRKGIAWLQIIFRKDGIAKIKKATCKFTSKSLSGACVGSTLGGCFPEPPDVRLNVGSGFKDGSGAKAFPRKHYSGDIYYSSHDVISQTVTWNSSYTVTDNPTVAIRYQTGNASYKSYEEGCIQIKNVSLSVSYIPKQTTSFS